MAVSFYFRRFCFFELFLFAFPSRDLTSVSNELKWPDSLPEVYIQNSWQWRIVVRKMKMKTNVLAICYSSG